MGGSINVMDDLSWRASAPMPNFPTHEISVLARKPCGWRCWHVWPDKDVVVPRLNEIVEHLDDILFFAQERRQVDVHPLTASALVCYGQ